MLQIQLGDRVCFSSHFRSVIQGTSARSISQVLEAQMAQMCLNPINRPLYPEIESPNRYQVPSAKNARFSLAKRSHPRLKYIVEFGPFYSASDLEAGRCHL